MSRLDSFIRRMVAQRDCINLVSKNLTKIEGPVLELGFGNGRTYDHICEKLKGRDVFVSDRSFKFNSELIRDKSKMLIGEIQENIPNILNKVVNNKFVLIHSDIGDLIFDNTYPNEGKQNFLSIYLPQILHSDGTIISDLELHSNLIIKVKNPAGISDDEVYMYQLKK